MAGYNRLSNLEHCPLQAGMKQLMLFFCERGGGGGRAIHYKIAMKETTIVRKCKPSTTSTAGYPHNLDRGKH